jgi:ABC-type uncharacterized transport system ATPase subunit
LPSPAVCLDHVSRRFGAVVAVRDASLELVRGRIHALIGENGAGKSTLLGLIGGMHPPDAGRVLIDGTPLVPATPAHASRRGVGFVHQHFMLVDAFTAIENVMLGAEPVDSLRRLDFAAARRQAEKAMNDLGARLDLDALVADLGVGERQTLEILRVIVRGATIILLDEPTAVLTPAQAEKLFASVRRMADAGACVAVVTHRLREVLDHCDDVTVMRRGEVVMTGRVAETDAAALTRAIMGAEPPPPVERPPDPGRHGSALALSHVSVAGTGTARAALHDVSLVVPPGRIVGIAGIEGNGQTELVQAIAGLLPVDSGEILVCGQAVTRLGVGPRRLAGLIVVHADRHRDGLMLDASVFDNLVLGEPGGRNQRSLVQRRMDRFGIVPSDPALPARALSGGNQQKLVTARALDRPVRAVVLSQPTRGVDLGAARAIHGAICTAASGGAGVLVVSADLAELRAICHEVIVLARGRLVASFPPDTPEEVFGRAMLGASGIAGGVE